MIIVDSREKQWQHIRDYFDRNGVPYEFPHKLDEGDYYNTENPNVIVDRKANLQEVCGNLSRGNNNIIRFIKECKRAKERHLRFVVLIEGTNARNVNDLQGWQSKYGKYTGRWLADKMFAMTYSYDVEWVFCKKSETAKKILEIVGYEENGKKTNIQNNKQKDGTDDGNDGGFVAEGDQQRSVRA